MNKISYSILIILVVALIALYLRADKAHKKRVKILKRLEEILEDGVIDESEKADIAKMIESMKTHKQHELPKKMKISAFNGLVRGLLFGVITGDFHSTIMGGATQGCLAPICTYIETLV